MAGPSQEISMALSYVTYPGSASQVLYGFEFSYINQAHVHVYVDGEEVAFTFANAYTVELAEPAGEGTLVKIARETPTGRLVDYVNGSNLNESTMDMDSNQLVYIVQEAYDALTTTITRPDAASDFDAVTKRIVNLADPVDDQDAVTKLWAETNMTSTLAQAITALNAAVVAKDESEAAQALSEAAQALAEAARDAALQAKSDTEGVAAQNLIDIAAAGDAELADIAAAGDAKLADINLANLIQDYGTEWRSLGNLEYIGETVELTLTNGVNAGYPCEPHLFTARPATYDVEGKNPAFLLALESGVGGDTIKFLVRGIVRNTAWSWLSTEGVLYLGNYNLTTTRPTGAGKLVQALGVSLAADTILWEPSLLTTPADLESRLDTIDGALSGFEPADSDILKADQTDNLVVGFSSDVYAHGNINSGYTVSLTEECLQTITINQNAALAPPSSGNGCAVIIASNDATGGHALTTGGFTVVNGEYDNAPNKVHRFVVTKVGSVSILDITEVS